MSTIAEIKAAIETLPDADYKHLRHWFNENDWNNWDRQIEADSQAGKLDFLLSEARQEKSKGNLQDL